MINVACRPALAVSMDCVQAWYLSKEEHVQFLCSQHWYRPLYWKKVEKTSEKSLLNNTYHKYSNATKVRATLLYMRMILFASLLAKTF